MTEPIIIPGRSWQANSYIFDNILIDAGITEDKISPYADTIEKIVITHGHYDHIAHLPGLAAACNAEIYIGEFDYEFLSNPELSLSSHFGAAQPVIQTEQRLRDGDRIGEFVVCHTPGHTRGSICLFRESDGTLVSGDTIFPGGDYGRCDLPTGNMADLKKSIERLAKLPVESIWCGHGTPAPRDGTRNLQMSWANVQREP
ncbi:MAG TPA: MBL fold metallo-hydrolase [Methanocorpusculum sp.]|nr:MBL fold metallo-hydrolase [Methanocorpusculum sp.]